MSGILKEVNENERIAHIAGTRKKLFGTGISIIHSWLFQCNKETTKTKRTFLKAGFSAVRDGLWIVHNSDKLDIDVHDLYFSGQLGIR